MVNVKALLGGAPLSPALLGAPASGVFELLLGAAEPVVDAAALANVTVDVTPLATTLGVALARLELDVTGEVAVPDGVALASAVFDAAALGNAELDTAGLVALGAPDRFALRAAVDPVATP